MTTNYDRYVQSALLVDDIQKLVDGKRWPLFVGSKDTLIPSIEILAELERALKKAKKMVEVTSKHEFPEKAPE